MPLDFDVKTFVEHIQGLKPPYECPVKGCGKVYRSFPGMQNHMYQYDHDNPENNTPNKKPGCHRKKTPWRKGNGNRGRSPTPDVTKKNTRDAMTYAEAQRMVEVDLDGEIRRINIFEPIEIMSQDEIDNCDNTEKEERIEKAAQKGGKGGKGGKGKEASGKQKKEPVPTPHNGPKLPEASFKKLDNHKAIRAPNRSGAFIRFIEKTVEELDEDIEYDMDEEDQAWLQLMNHSRKEDNLNVVSQESFEMLMDRFEKEAFFQSQTAGKDSGPPIDDDAVCAICMDGECQNSNVILFCDMCNLAVHQECYGVPYIPEGQWLCRRCLQSPSRAVDCCLCPNKGGAFKQTDDGRWAHVVCALWIPEVGFSNTVFLEPIDSIAAIPPARWKLTCYICKQRGNSACIQCHKTNCYTAFHVTCAQQAGLYMKIEPVRESTIQGTTISVRKTAFCDVHTPPNMDFHPMIDNGVSSEEENKGKSSLTPAEVKAKSRTVMRKARKILAEKRNAVPIVSIPTISPKKLDKIAGTVNLSKKNQFISRLQTYWTLKRQSRNGVPLLRRLQSSHMSRNREQTHSDTESNTLREQLKYWQRLRQDLERTRLLVELIRKREKLKREQLRLQQLATEMKLTPFLMLLRHTMDQLEERDTSDLFKEPVDADEVPDYLTVIKEPMDLKTMREKMENHDYTRIEEFETDFDGMVSNCLRYNDKDTPFYKQGIRMRDQGGIVIRAARRIAEKVGYDPATGLHLDQKPKYVPQLLVHEEDGLLRSENREGMSLEEQLRTLLDSLDVLNATRPKRSKLATKIKREVVKVRQQLALQRGEKLLSDDECNRSMGTASETEDKSQESSPERSVSLSPKREVGRGGRGRPRVRGRGRPRLKSRDTDHESEAEADTSAAADTSQVEEAIEEEPVETSAPGSPTPSSNPPSPTRRSNPPSPSRRSSVQSGRKSRKQSQSADEDDSAIQSTSQPTTSKGRSARKSRSRASSQDEKEDEVIVVKEKPTRVSHRGTPTPRKRSATAANSDCGAPASKRVATGKESTPNVSAEAASPIPRHKESFRQYRQLSGAFESELDETSDSGSTDESISTSDTGDSSDSDADDGARVTSDIPLEPLDLVWAKCRGYPWYPALVINPKMPKTGYFHNGVPIPVPPDEVLNAQRKYDEQVFLVLFFDTKRTWQWLPNTKLEPLGVDSARDKGKLLENKKPNVRKAVRKAYEKAILHRCRVTGEPNPLSPVSDPDSQ